jgi:hypothetical protein
VKKNERAKIATRSAYSIEDGGKGNLKVDESEVAMEVVRSFVVLVTIRIFLW